MTAEIERKFLVTGPGWSALAGRAIPIRQAYLAQTDRVSVRVRVKGSDTAFLTVKSAEAGMSRLEVETRITVPEAEDLLALRQGALIVKRRYPVAFGGLVWEIDVFAGDNEGLIIAEVELPSTDHAVDLPPWVGREVTDDVRYYNASLANAPMGGD